MYLLGIRAKVIQMSSNGRTINVYCPQENKSFFLFELSHHAIYKGRNPYSGCQTELSPSRGGSFSLITSGTWLYQT